MLKAVLDTNVIVSGAITDHGVCFHILKNWEKGEFVLVISEPILEEIDRVLHYPHIKDKRHLTEQNIEAVLQALRTYGLNVPAKINIKAISEDPDDEKFISAAVEGEANYIVSGDRHLKALKIHRGIKIISPSEFMQILHSKP